MNVENDRRKSFEEQNRSIKGLTKTEEKAAIKSAQDGNIIVTIQETPDFIKIDFKWEAIRDSYSEKRRNTQRNQHKIQHKPIDD